MYFLWGDTITVNFSSGKNVSGVVLDESIGAVKNIYFHVEVTDEEVMLFEGGA